MNKFKKIALLLISLLLSSACFSQNSKDLETYNMGRGFECLHNDDNNEALKYFLQELEANPSNGYAMVCAAAIYRFNEIYGTAMSYVNNSLKKLPKSDKAYQAFAYSERAGIYLNLNDTVSAIKDYTTAISFMPEEEDYYEERANIYYFTKQYNLAEKDYKTLIQLNPGSVMGYMGLGRNMKEQGYYEDAIKQFEHAIKLDPTYSHGYAFRAEAYLNMEEYALAAEDIIVSLSIDHNDKAFYLMQQIGEKNMDLMISKLKIQTKKEPSTMAWLYYTGVIYERNKRLTKAVENYKKVADTDAGSFIYNRIAECYFNNGDFEQAIQYSELSYSYDTTNYSALENKSDAELELNLFDEAIADMDKVLDEYPDYGGGYYRRGWIKENAKYYEDAIEDFSMAIALKPEYAYSYCCRGKLYLMQGRKNDADKDFNKIIEIEKDIENATCLQYAYYYLGNKEKAIEIMQQLLEYDSIDNYYDAACLYSLSGEKETSLRYLRLALETGFNRFSHIDRDSDMDNVRNSQEFKDLIEEFKGRNTSKISSKSTVFIEKESEIPFIKEGDMCKVECDINGLHLHFILDTGASIVSISSVEATFMLKNNYLSPNDIIGTQNYINANGEISEGTVVNLKTVKIGELTLNNVRASVAKNQRAPLLLGQSVLGRLGKIEIDNMKKVIRVNYKVEK